MLEHCLVRSACLLWLTFIFESEMHARRMTTGRWQDNFLKAKGFFRRVLRAGAENKTFHAEISAENQNLVILRWDV
jgi:hypothetical protein